MTLGPARITAFFAVLVLLAGYLFVFRPLEASIAARYAALDDGRSLLDRALAIAKRSSELAREERELQRWLRAGGLREGRTAVMNRFLRIAAASAIRDDVRITAVATEPTLPAHAATFDETPLSLTLRGSYGRVLRLLLDLDRAPIAARIAVGAFGDADRAAHEPTLRATIHVTLLRAPDPPESDVHAHV